jgi:hypothetical protein
MYDTAPHHQGGEVEHAWARHRLAPHRLPLSSPQMNAAEPWMGGVKETVSAHSCWQERMALVRSFMGFVASMTKRPGDGRRRGVPDRLGFNCV